MSSYNLLRSGFKSYSILLRPHSTLQSSFVSRAANVTKKRNVLLTGNQVRTNLIEQVARPQPIRSASTTVRDPSVTVHWTYERYLAIALLGIIPIGLNLHHPITDTLLGAALIVHANRGVHSIVIDYLHGPVLPKLGGAILTVVSVLAFVGICYFNYADIGLSRAIKKVWSL